MPKPVIPQEHPDRVLRQWMIVVQETDEDLRARITCNPVTERLDLTILKADHPTLEAAFQALFRLLGSHV